MDEKIKQVFKSHYFDLRIYRFAARHRVVTQYVYPALWLSAVLFSLGGMMKTSAVLGASFVLWIFVTAIDHIIIGFSIRRVMRALEREGIKTSWEYVVRVVGLK
jgi:hypothetical protein